MHALEIGDIATNMMLTIHLGAVTSSLKVRRGEGTALLHGCTLLVVLGFSGWCWWERALAPSCQRLVLLGPENVPFELQDGSERCKRNSMSTTVVSKLRLRRDNARGGLTSQPTSCRWQTAKTPTGTSTPQMSDRRAVCLVKRKCFHTFSRCARGRDEKRGSVPLCCHRVCCASMTSRMHLTM